MGETMRIILIGPPGSGKGTQAIKFAKEFALDHISTGDLLRHNPHLTQEQKEIISSGKLIPDAMMLEIVKSKLDMCGENGWILDGYPRTIEQAENLSSILPPHSFKVIYFHIDEKELVDRITGRLTCSSCGEVYHKKNKVPLKELRCDSCQGDLIHRNDDSEEVIKKRLETYHKFTTPVINYYKLQGVLYNLESGSTKTIEEIFDSMKKILIH